MACAIIEFISVSWITRGSNRTLTILTQQRRLEMAAHLTAEVEVGFRRIYGREDARAWNSKRRKRYRDNQLDGNPDVLFGVFKPVYPTIKKKPQSFLFRPKSDPIWWMMVIRNQYENLTVQWTLRRVKEPVRDVITVSGKWEDLEEFCLKFSNHLQEINNNPVKNSPVDDHIEDLTARIQDLELENKKLTEENKSKKS